MTGTEPTTPPTGADAFEPDEEALWEVFDVMRSLRAVIDEYLHQLAARGWVMVSAEDAQTTGRFAIDAFKTFYKNGTTDVLDAVYDCCFRVYEAGRIARLAAADGGER